MERQLPSPLKEIDQNKGKILVGLTAIAGAALWSRQCTIDFENSQLDPWVIDTPDPYTYQLSEDELYEDAKKRFGVGEVHKLDEDIPTYVVNFTDFRFDTEAANKVFESLRTFYPDNEMLRTKEVLTIDGQRYYEVVAGNYEIKSKTFYISFNGSQFPIMPADGQFKGDISNSSTQIDKNGKSTSYINWDFINRIGTIEDTMTLSFLKEACNATVQYGLVSEEYLTIKDDPWGNYIKSDRFCSALGTAMFAKTKGLTYEEYENLTTRQVEIIPEINLFLDVGIIDPQTYEALPFDLQVLQDPKPQP